MLRHPALAKFARHILPRPEDINSQASFRDAGQLMPWHDNVRPAPIVKALNRMIDYAGTGGEIFFSYYKGEARRKNTGLFFFRGRPDAPFALICPGGGFSYIGSLHEGFPLAQAISERAFNAFVIQYRTGGEKIASEDLGAALAWIFAHAAEFEISTRGYSVWGGSAGGRMAANLGSYGPEALGAGDLPRPCAIIIAYSGRDWFTKRDVPTFSVVSRDDPIASAKVMAARTKAMREAGIEAEIAIYNNSGHGFGIGEGSDAAGWVDLALSFWEKRLAELGLLGARIKGAEISRLPAN